MLVDWRINRVLSITLLSIVAVMYVHAGHPYPRPIFVFVGLGGVLVLLYSELVFSSVTSLFQKATFIAAGLLTSFLFRWTAYTGLTAAGSDYISHYAVRAAFIIQNGYVSPLAGQYNFAPLIHVFISSYAILAGVSGMNAKIFMIVSSSLLPLLISIFAALIFGERAGLHALILASVFPLFMRTGAIFETEALVLPWFAMFMYLIFRYQKTSNRNLLIAIVPVVLATSWLHFFYPVIVIWTGMGTLLIINVVSKTNAWKRTFQQRNTVPIYVLSSGVFLVMYRLLWSAKGSRLVIAIGLSNSHVKTPTSIYSLFVPTSGAVSNSTTGGEPLLKLLNFAPILIFAVLVGMGGLYTLYKSRENDLYVSLIIGSLVLFVMTMVGLVAFSAESSMQIGFRLYYFLSLFGLLFAAAASSHLTKNQDIRGFMSLRRIVQILAVAILCIYFVAAPMSSLGNRVDPRLGGSPLAITDDDSSQIRALEHTVPGDTEVRDVRALRLSLPPKKGPFAPSIAGSGAVSLSSKQVGCGQNATVWTGGRVLLCSEK